MLSTSWRPGRASGTVPIQTSGPRMGGEMDIGVGAGVSLRLNLKSDN